MSDLVGNPNCCFFHAKAHFLLGSLEEFKSVLAGGACQGWLPDVSVVLWRRMLGALGDVNKIEDPAIHASVFEHLCDLQDTLQRVG